MAAGAGVLGRVAVRRVVAAARRAALLAGPEVDPIRAGLHALLALPALGMFDGRDSADMRAALVCHARQYAFWKAKDSPAQGLRRRRDASERIRCMASVSWSE